MGLIHRNLDKIKVLINEYSEAIELNNRDGCDNIVYMINETSIKKRKATQKAYSNAIPIVRLFMEYIKTLKLIEFASSPNPNFSQSSQKELSEHNKKWDESFIGLSAVQALNKSLRKAIKLANEIEQETKKLLGEEHKLFR